MQCGLDLETGRTRETNIFRDREYIVAPIESAVFPNRCVKTNEPVAEADFKWVADLSRSQIAVDDSAGEAVARGAARLLLGSAAAGLVDLAQKQRLEFKIGLSEELQRRSQWRWRVGLALVIAGPFIGFALSMITMMIVTSVATPTPNEGLTVSVAAGIPGLLVTTAGLILFGMSTLSVLHPIRSDGRHVWLSGAHPDFLASLPESSKKWKPLLANWFGGK